jgi:ABC-type phosphate/phosphonate transport system permease subunit
MAFLRIFPNAAVAQLFLRLTSLGPRTETHAHRMMIRSLTYLDGRMRSRKAAAVTVEKAGQVNIASRLT